MSSDEHLEHPDQGQTSKRGEPSPAARKRLQKIFEHASKQMAQDAFDYASDLFGQCVIQYPVNFIYLQNFLGNLHKKYGNNKKGSPLAQFKERGARSAMKKAVSQGEWEEVIKNGVAVLKINPWDVPTLTAMASALEGFVASWNSSGQFSDGELFLLKCALEANPKDPDVNRLCGIALGKRGQFDQAIACWHRVEQAKPDDEEPKRAIASLAVEKTIVKFDENDPNKKKRPQPGDLAKKEQQVELSPEDLLRQKIAREPKELMNYHELAQLYLNSDRFKEAEEVYARAFEASDGSPDVREKWEDAQVRHLRHRYTVADKKAKEGGAPEAVAEAKKIRKEYMIKQLTMYKNRAERYPSNLGFKYDLGLQYKSVGQYSEAIREFQLARNDPRRKGLCMLALGECFQKIKQFRLAMEHYEVAIEEIPDRDADNKKLALYRAGTLAREIGVLEKARKYLNILASLDFAYRDVSSLLDELARLGDDNENKE